MDQSKIILYVVIVLLMVLGISFLIEAYKKFIRKDKAKKWEIRLVALILTIGIVVILNVIHIFQPVLQLLGAPLWADWIFYTIILYILQLQADMKIAKKLFKMLIKNILVKAGLTSDQANELIEKSSNGLNIKDLLSNISNKSTKS